MDEQLTDIQALEQFVVDNDKLLDLEARIGRFNIFDALRIVDQEIRHSNFLAWLLDPGESHAMGGLFLNAVLMDLLRKTPVKDRLFSPIKLDGGELRGVEVRREWKNIDLLITCKDPSFVIAIENKVRSREHSDQLARYQKTVDSDADLSRFTKKQFVFLTRVGDLPSEDQWTVYSYADLYEVLDRVIGAYGEQLGEDVAAFIDHYLRILRSRLMQDEDIAELCREIYRNHRQAIDLIQQHTAGSLVARDLHTLIVNHSNEWHVYPGKRGRRTAVQFHPLSWRKWLPPAGKLRAKKGQTRWFFFRLGESRGSLYLTLRVNPTSDPSLQKGLIEALLAEKEKLGLALPRKKKGIGTPGYQGVVHRVRWCEAPSVDLTPSEEFQEIIAGKLDQLFLQSQQIEAVVKRYLAKKKPTP